MPAKYTALLCDDIRMEDNGKYLAIGIYSNGLQSQSRYVQSNFTLFLVVTNVAKGDHTLHLTLETNNNRSEETSYPFEVLSDTHCSTLHFHGIPLDAYDPQFFKMWARVDDEEEVEVLNVPVLVPDEE